MLLVHGAELHPHKHSEAAPRRRPIISNRDVLAAASASSLSTNSVHMEGGLEVTCQKKCLGLDLEGFTCSEASKYDNGKLKKQRHCLQAQFSNLI